MYKLVKSRLESNFEFIQKMDGNVLITIPKNPENNDYQEYLKWLAEGNTPEPADQGE